MQREWAMMNTRRKHGQSLVEFALLLPILVLLVGGLFDVGRAFFIQIAVENAAGEGALYGINHPECLMHDHSPTTCQDAESVIGRIREEGKPTVDLNDENSTIVVETVNNAPVTAGAVLRIEVTYSYTPMTFVGQIIWGETATVFTSALQVILSPPPPGYQY